MPLVSVNPSHALESFTRGHGNAFGSLSFYRLDFGTHESQSLANTIGVFGTYALFSNSCVVEWRHNNPQKLKLATRNRRLPNRRKSTRTLRPCLPAAAPSTPCRPPRNSACLKCPAEALRRCPALRPHCQPCPCIAEDPLRRRRWLWQGTR